MYLQIYVNIIRAFRDEQNGWHCADYIFEGIFFNENDYVMNKILLNFVHGSIRQIISISWGNDLVPNVHQAITWIDDDQDLWINMASLDYNLEFDHWGLVMHKHVNE